MLQLKSVIIFLLIYITGNNAKSQNSFIWGKQLGTVGEDYSLNHVIDKNGSVYISGKTTGAMDGNNFGGNDGFITKIDSSGNTIWTKQFGTAEEEDVLWSAADGDGNVYITGSTKGSLGSGNSGGEDIFVIKYTPAGQVEWTKQFGTDSTDIGNGIYADEKGFIYITGATSGNLGGSPFGRTDGIIIKLDSDGNKISAYQFGTKMDDYGIAITGGNRSNIFVCGTTLGDLGAANKGFMDAFVGSFTEKCELIKFTQFGTDGFDIALQVISDSTDLYAGGTTTGNLGCSQIGNGDCFISRISPEGGIAWTSQFGTKSHDSVRGIDLNKKTSENFLVSGLLNLPPGRAFIRMYKKDGSLLWERIIREQGADVGVSGKTVSLGNNGNIYHLGLTGGNLFGQLIGEHDIYLMKLALDQDYMDH